MLSCQLHLLQNQPYDQTWDFQRNLFQDMLNQKAAKENTLPLHLIMIEHPHVYTFGKSADRENLLASDQALNEMQAKVYDIERGGDITYHGPGQLVVYPIFDLEALGMGVKVFVQNIEKVIINTLAEYNIIAGTIPDRIGVWVDIDQPNERKIAAIGIKCSRFVSMHGLALNVNTDLSMFNHIVPCGIVDKGVTSMEKELGGKIDMFEVKEKMGKHFASIFELEFIS
jgi:lipoyl(octanoyl) transferase